MRLEYGGVLTANICTMRTYRSALGCLLCVSLQCAEAASAPPSTDEALRILARQDRQPLVHVMVSPGRRKTEWYVQADTPSKPSRVAGICETQRVWATLSPAASGVQRWSWQEINQTTAVALVDATAKCEQLTAADFYEITALVRLEDLRILKQAVDQIYPCARQRHECSVRLLATPWAILDAIADAPEAPRIGDIDYDPNLSRDPVALYDVRLILKGDRRSYNAVVTLSNQDIVQVQLAEIVP